MIGGFSFLGLLFAILVADRLNPPPLQRAQTRSVVVADRHGEVLRTFLARDGAWRLPVRHQDVDPRFIRYLMAWEDQRFGAHPGVDPFALLRAAYQLARDTRIVSGGSTLT
ncbi:MAG TPA: penicillin-binding protein 1C, partial [Alphaproteobacteria bacterium]|nr:penicillin-binding protein 1C [Alphaproteobacteria bacterium]